MQALGPDFTRSALTNQDNHVSARVSVFLLYASSLQRLEGGDIRCCERSMLPRRRRHG